MMERNGNGTKFQEEIIRLKNLCTHSGHKTTFLVMWHYYTVRL